MSNTDTRKWFGQNAAAIIKSKGITKRAVSEKSGIPYSTLNAVLKGYRPVSLDQVLRIAEATGETPTKFLPPEFFGSSEALAAGEES